MEPTLEQKKGWEEWLSGRPENVRSVAERLVPWKKYRYKRVVEDIGNRYSPRAYSEEADGSVTVTCEKSNDKMPFLGGYGVFGIDPNDLIEAD